MTLLNSLQGLGFDDGGAKDWQTTPLSELTKYIVNKHHTFVRAELFA